MDNRGGCCIARYGYGGGAYDMSQIDRIMLRFRPIAPKPANARSSSSRSSPGNLSEVAPSKSGRGKRRFNATNGHNDNNNNNNNNNSSRRCNNGGSTNNRKRKSLNENKVDAVVTLPLLPETPDRIYKRGKETSPVQLLSPRQAKNVPTWLSFASSADQTVGSLPRRVVVGSCVTVECVTDAWVDVDGLGRTDEERKMNLERDTCPGFISDDFGRVTETNEAYKKMVGQGVEVVVWLVMKDNKVRMTVAPGSNNNRTFTCKVRVQNQSTCGHGNERSSITVPCDVWQMDGGGFAWRLDVKAALSLGR